AFAEAAKGIRALVEGYDWDGVNLAELYFESLEGMSNPARFTPMNDDIRTEFRRLHGVDPVDLFRAAAVADKEKVSRAFLDYRAGLAKRQQEEWMSVLEQIRRKKPYLDLAVTQIDDRFDARVHDLLGADASLTLPMLDEHDFTYLIE